MASRFHSVERSTVLPRAARGGRLLGCLVAVAFVFPTSVAGQPPATRFGRHRTRPATEPLRVDAAALASVGIHRYESRRLVLYSDVDPAVARTLPPLIDAACVAWAAYFGELPPAEDGGEFQLTGCLMKDRRPFLEAGLLPEDLVDFEHGRHRGDRFWMNEQAYDYYRRHLLIHEGTHCYMMILPATTRPPLFYLEGMAEFFGTHAIDDAGRIHFGGVPADPDAAVGFGRVEMIRQAVAEGRMRSLDDVLNLSANDFAASKSEPYAWSWALCTFLDAHPRTRERFRKLAAIVDGAEFRRELGELLASVRPALDFEWDLFVRTLEYGHDIERAAIDFKPGERLPPGGSLAVAVEAGRGWQCTSIAVEAGRTYRLTAEGQVALASDPRPWLSEPQGVSIRYSGGRPIGRLLAGVHGDAAPDAAGRGRLTDTIDVGRATTFTAPVNGVLYLRVNDAWGRLDDNTGEYRATIEAVEAPR